MARGGRIVSEFIQVSKSRLQATADIAPEQEPDDEHVSLTPLSPEQALPALLNTPQISKAKDQA
jgi:hypothetical protein